jgi:hypothetical protein
MRMPDNLALVAQAAVLMSYCGVRMFHRGLVFGRARVLGWLNWVCLPRLLGKEAG